MLPSCPSHYFTPCWPSLVGQTHSSPDPCWCREVGTHLHTSAQKWALWHDNGLVQVELAHLPLRIATIEDEEDEEQVDEGRLNILQQQLQQCFSSSSRKREILAGLYQPSFFSKTVKQDLEILEVFSEDWLVWQSFWATPSMLIHLPLGNFPFIFFHSLIIHGNFAWRGTKLTSNFHFGNVNKMQVLIFFTGWL